MLVYNDTYSSTPTGLTNIGSICYLNSLLQALLSCTSFVQQIYHTASGNPIIKQFINVCMYNKTISNFGINMYNILNKHFHAALYGQHCFHEVFDILMDSISTINELSQLFSHTYKTYSFCTKCDRWSRHKDSVENAFMINSETKITEDCIQTPEIQLDNLECTTCKDRSQKKIRYVLSVIPEILVIISQNYEKKQYIEFPPTLKFTDKLQYIAVAQIEHIGSRTDGHYWTCCRRDLSETWYCCDDGVITKTEFKPTINTYAIFYHVI